MCVCIIHILYNAIEWSKMLEPEEKTIYKHIYIYIYIYIYE